MDMPPQWHGHAPLPVPVPGDDQVQRGRKLVKSGGAQILDLGIKVESFKKSKGGCFSLFSV